MSSLQVEWKRLLEEYNGLVLQSDKSRQRTPNEIREAGWCGQPPASEAQIQAAENRLAVVLPPSYREFLKVTNGWWAFDWFFHRLWPVEEIGWYRDVHPDWAEAGLREWERRGRPTTPDDIYFDYARWGMTGDYRDDHLPECLVLAEGIDAELLLLNPKVVNPDGEWEAWYLASWIPGAERYPSFLALYRHQLEFHRRHST